MAFRKKANAVLALKPDIIIIPEAEHPEKINFSSHTQQPTQVFWQGNNPNKGLLIASYNQGIQLKEIERDLAGKYALPIEVKTHNTLFNILGVWAQRGSSSFDSYIVQAARATKSFERHFSDNTILFGDFNSNSCWDNADKKETSHSQYIEYLEKFGVRSSYHLFFDEKQGAETCPTLYMYRNRLRPYHVDHGFLSSALISKLRNVEVGRYEDWSDKSDHMPLILEFNQL